MTQVWNRDCMEAMKEFEDKFFDLAVVDPPYRDENEPTQSMRNKTGYQPDLLTS